MSENFLLSIPDFGNRFIGQPFLFGYINGTDVYIPHKYSYKTESGKISTVRERFIFDFASIPRPLQVIYPSSGNGRDYYGIAALWHDWLYVHRKIDGCEIMREEADDLFYEIMIYVGVRSFTAHAMYQAVRKFGWVPWNRRKESDIIP